MLNKNNVIDMVKSAADTVPLGGADSQVHPVVDFYGFLGGCASSHLIDKLSESRTNMRWHLYRICDADPSQPSTYEIFGNPTLRSEIGMLWYALSEVRQAPQHIRFVWGYTGLPKCTAAGQTALGRCSTLGIPHVLMLP